MTDLTRSRRRALVVVPVVLMVLAAACGGDKKKAPAETTIATTTTTLPPIAPLTGRFVTDPALVGRPSLAVKIDNNADARPQAGIELADVVYEEVTEGITRFVTVFQSQNVDQIGPVRSVRPADPLIVDPLGGLFVFSGGSPAAVALVTGAGLATATENDTAALKRRSSRRAPHNLYTSTADLYALPQTQGLPAPPPLAQFLKQGETFAAAGAVPTLTIEVPIAPNIKADYAWDAPATAWKRSTNGDPHLLENNAQIGPQNVIVQFAPYSRFAEDAKVTYPEVIGTGEAWIFANGMLAQGKWSKPAASAVTAFTDAAGAPIVLPPGQTFVELVAPGTTISTTGPPPPAAPTTTTP
ncbi:MAG: hypothetical protein QOJ69_1373 [Actinomycetota bacterium]|nr:hypothetical protein [Actinomycetota bacterium]